MARTNGPIQVWSRTDTTPTDVEGGYAGGDSTAAAVGTSLDQSSRALGTVDNLAVTASTLDYGQAATATISGTSPWKTIHVGIPKGMPETVGAQLTADAAASADAATLARDDADAAVLLAQQAQAAAYNVPDVAMRDIINNPATETRAALDTYGARMTTAGTGDEAAAIQAWLDTPSPLAVKTLVGPANITAALTVPAGVHLDLTSATLTVTKATGEKIGVTLSAGATLTGGRVVMDPADYVANASPTSIAVDAVGDGSTVRAVRTENAAGAGVRVRGADVTVDSCVIVGPGATYIAPDDGSCFGVLTAAATRPCIRRNLISEAAQGISTDSATTSPQITDNIIRDIRGQHGMYLHRVDGSIIAGNRIDGCSYGHGIKAQIDANVPEDVVATSVAGNVVTNCGVGQGIWGIIIYNSVPPYTRKYVGLTVAGNIVAGCGRGVLIGSARGVTIAGNTVRDIYSTGWSLRDCEDVDFAVGSVSHIGGRAIGLDGLGSTTNRRVTIRDGRIHNPGDAGLAQETYGIFVGSGSDITVESITQTVDNGYGTYALFFSASGDPYSQSSLTVRDVTSTGQVAQAVRFLPAPAPPPRELVNVPGPMLYQPAGPVRVGTDTSSTRYAASGLPTSGAYSAGDSIRNTTPSAGGTVEWVVTGSGGLHSGYWAASTAYTAGVWVRTSAGRILEATVGGTSGTTEPTPPAAIGGTVTDGSVVWTYRATAPAVVKVSATVAA